MKKLNLGVVNLHWDLVGSPPILPVKASATRHADLLNVLLTEECDTAMPRRVTVLGKRQVYWWNNQIADLRKIAITVRRAYQRASRRSHMSSREPEREAYSRARLDLKHAIRKSQEDSWRELCLSVENDPWGVPYKLVTKRLGRRAPDLDCNSVVRVARGFFPSSPETHWARIPNVSQQSAVIADLSLLNDDSPLVSPITVQEIDTAVARLPSKKAPGPDLVPNDIIKLAYSRFPDDFVRCYNACLKNGVFPVRWKRAQNLCSYIRDRVKRVTNLPATDQ